MEISIPHLTINYMRALSKKKMYNPQVRSIKGMLFQAEDRLLIELKKSFKEFRKSNELIISKDFHFKNDSFTPRNMLLISPMYYMYYTNLIFHIFEGSKFLSEGILNFSNERMRIFYSGILEYTNNIDTISKNATFDKSYNQFKRCRENIFNKHILKIDIKDFFNSIPIPKLIQKLKKCFGEESIYINELECFFVECNISTLPQFHYSIGSSILSQFYLKEFDEGIQTYLNDKDAMLLRFVDDMYISKNEPFSDKEYHTIIDNINSLLWKDNLVLNINKTKLFLMDEFEENYKLVDLDGYDEELDYIVEENIKQRAIEIIEDDSFFNLLMKLNELYDEQGVNIKKYKTYLEEISDDDHSKIFNSIIYSNKWMKVDADKLFEMIKCWKYIFFNPSQFTIFFIKVTRYLENKNKEEYPYIKNFLNYFYKLNEPVLREIISVNTYLYQNKRKNGEILNVLKNINSSYVEFIEKYL